MTHATEEQKNQLLSLIATGTDRRKLDKIKLQGRLDDPKFSDEFALWVNSYEPASVPVEPPIPLTPFRDNLPLGATKTKPMVSLFKDGNGVVYFYRDSCLDNWFTSDSPESKAGTFRIVTTPKVMTFRQMAQSATGLTIESIGDLSRAITEQGLDITPVQFDEQIVATQAGADILLTNGWASFAFAKTGKTLKDDKGEYVEVVVLDAYRLDAGQWRARAHRLDLSGEWHGGDRLLLRNRV